MTIAKLKQEVDTSHRSIHVILSDDLKKRHVSVEFVPRQLTMNRLKCCMMVTGDLFEKNIQDPTFLKIITGDELLVFAYVPEMKGQSSDRHTASSPTPKKSCLVRSKEKVMLIAFFDIDCLVHHEFVPPGQSVTGHFYVPGFAEIAGCSSEEATQEVAGTVVSASQ
jgi:hypothetical protein